MNIQNKKVDNTSRHTVLDTLLLPPFPENCREIWFAMGCFWGVERLFWQVSGIHTTAVGYAGGHSQNPDYKQVCTGQTGHTETVRVVYNPREVQLEYLLKLFWENHDPTQGMRQGNDIGSQYRSAIFYHNNHQKELVERSRAQYQVELRNAGLETITTEVSPAEIFYFAEDYHQQYLDKNPAGYCAIGGTGLCMPES
ncbi:MAG: peptide-methionine (S)-S-oxide reductase MsrA [bacterium]